MTAVLIGGKGDDLLHGGDLGLEVGTADGIDTADYSQSTAGIVADLETGTVADGLGGFDKLVSIEKITGTAFDDHFIGGEGEWAIDGGGGANDTIDYSNIDGVRRGADNNTILLPSGAVQHLINIEHIIGASANDELFGNASDNVLIGGIGVDEIHGGDGVDVLIGGDGDDILYGDDDNNTVDYLNGGAGADEFHVGEGDIVLNFNAGDKIYLNDVLLGGGENFSQWYDAPPGAEIRRLPFVDANGVAYTFVETGFGEGGAMAVMTADMKMPVLIFGVELTEDEEAAVRKVSGVEEGSYQSVELVAEGGFMRFTRWDGIDHHISGLDPIPEVPQYAKDLYDWEDAGGVPGEFSEETETWDIVDAAPERAVLSGYDGFAQTWDQQLLLTTWGSGGVGV